MVKQVSRDFAMMAIVGEVLVRALIHGPAWASSPSIRTPISDQIHCSRGSKTSAYHVWAASRMTAGCCPTSPSKFLIIVFTLTPVPSPPDTLARDNPLGKGAATERHATEARRPEPLKPPDLPTDDLEKSGGASALDDSPILHGGGPGDLDSLGLAAVADMEARKVEPSGVDAHERGGGAAGCRRCPVLAEETAGVEPTGAAERAAAAKSEALAPWTQGETRRELETLPREGKGVHEPPLEAPPRKREREVDKPKHEALPQKGERKPEALLRERECERARTGAKPKPKVEVLARTRQGAATRARTRHNTARQHKQG